MSADPTVLSSKGEASNPVVEEARKRWNQAAEWESEFRRRFIDDAKFAIGDSDNGFQWPNAIRRSRDADQRPCLTMNVIRQHNLIISNEARKNKSSMKFIPLGNGATAASAEMWNAIARRVEQRSSAQAVYTIARRWQVDGGIGWWRLITDWVSNDSMDQDIIIWPINDPLAVYLDCDIQQPDGSDAKWGFVFDKVPTKQFGSAYPKWKQFQGVGSPLGVGTTIDNVPKDYTQICEYFRKVSRDDELFSFVHLNQRKTIRRSLLTPEMADFVRKDPMTRIRELSDEVVEWKLIVGEHIVDETTWPGDFIPLVRVVGTETVIEGRLDRCGHTRGMKDAQRMYNYNASSQVEFVALQGKTPWVAAAEAIEEYETVWNTANIVNHSVLVYNGLDDEGNAIAAPQRTQPPTASPAYQAGMETAFNQMMMTSGQWQNQMGMGGNERTGRAIEGRQRQSDTATFHFQDNYEMALRFTARQIKGLAPKVYDTKRVLMMMGEDGTSMEVLIDPAAKEHFAQQQAANGLTVQRVFNPTMGDYDVAETFGPAYGSKRERTVDALTLILTQAPQLTPLIGDYLLASMDFDKADEAAQRLRRMVPPQALGIGPTQNEKALQGTVVALKQSLASALEQSGKDKLKLVGKAQSRQIEAYKAITDRIKALQPEQQADPEMMRPLVEELVQAAMTIDLEETNEESEQALRADDSAGTEEKPPMPDARKAPDGKWYTPDPHPARKGKFLRVEAA